MSQVIADVENFYVDLIIINLYLKSFFRELADSKSFRHSGQNFPRMVDDFVESHVDIVLDPKI
jgi:hypothetical protein